MSDGEDRPDILYQYEEIGRYLGMTKNQAKHRATAGEIPTFRIGRIVCDSRKKLDAYMAKLSDSAERERANQG